MQPRKTLRRILAAAAFAAALVPALAAYAEGIAVVDLQGAVMQTEDGIRAQATMKKAFDTRQKTLDARQGELVKVRDDIQKQALILSREALQRRIDMWQRDMVDLQQTFVKFEQEMQKKQQELTAPIIQKMVAVIGRVASSSSFDVVIDKQAAPYSRADLDITDRVIQMYNSGDTGAAPAPTEPPKSP
ncbi:MAG: OmpH family outer membrane protein [Polyangiaceae bacterium]